MVRVTLSNGEHDELALGPFNQGVMMNSRLCMLVDVATGRPICELGRTTGLHLWLATQHDYKAYEQVFIQQIPIAEQRMILGAELDVLIMEAPHCPRFGCRQHEHCRRIQQARARLEELT